VTLKFNKPYDAFKLETSGAVTNGVAPSRVARVKITMWFAPSVATRTLEPALLPLILVAVTLRSLAAED
jgi:hypothetical protein